jgi:ABC-type glycerol-3-phosphate transport system substrate-binding protein
MSQTRVHTYNGAGLVAACWFLILILSACTDKANDDSWNDLDLLPDISEMELTAERLEIWWDDVFGLPYDLYAKGYLTKQYAKTAFDVKTFTFNQFGPNPAKVTNDLFHMLRTEPSPDLIVFDSRYLPLLIDIGYLEPVKVNAGYYEMDSSVIARIRDMAPDGELYAMPYGYSPAGLLYNKEIFDEMEVEYPRDGMTWKEILELARKVDDRSRWEALLVSDYDLVASQLSLRLINPDTQEADFESEAYKRLEEIAFELKSLQDYKRTTPKITAFSEGKAAMLAVLFFSNLIESTEGLYDRVMRNGAPDFEWDVVRIPVFDDGKAPANPMLLIGVPRPSLNKTDALIAMQFLLSKPVQEANTRKGFVSLRADMNPEEFAVELDFLADKNKQSLLRPASEAGTYDPDLDFLPVIDIKINSIMRIPAHNSEDIKNAVEHARSEINEEIRMYMDRRSRLIEDVRGKYGLD